MTVSVLKSLAVTPDGDTVTSLSLDQLGRYLRENCGTDADKKREERHILRDDLYNDGGVKQMEELIEQVFKKREVKDRRKQWVKFARFNNAIKRIVNELSTVYAEPAIRFVGAEADQEKYADVQRMARQDEQMVRVGRMFNLHPAIAVGFRLRQIEDGTREPVIDVATPSTFRVVLHPFDSTRVMGVLIRLRYRPAISLKLVPSWVLWTDHESCKFTEDFTAIPGTYSEHGLGVNPWTIVTKQPAVPGFWPGEDGESLVAAQMSIWFANVCMLKETKSATNVPTLQGDMTAAARDQAADSEDILELPEGTTVSTLDNSMDLSLFRDTSAQILDDVANNYGLSTNLLRHQGVQSAEARELMRVPLRELRKQQQIPLREFERIFAAKQAAIIGVDWPEMAFSVEGWGIDFADPQTPLTPTESLALFEKLRAAGLHNSVDYIVEQNPDMTEESAWREIERNIRIETRRNVLMRPLAAINGGPAVTFADDPRSAESNGAMGQKPPPGVTGDSPQTGATVEQASPANGRSEDHQ